MRREDAWFVVPTYGYGPGVPKSWQGWALLIALTAFILWVALTIIREQTLVASALVFGAFAFFLIIARAKSTGPWKWRWGRDEHTWKTPNE